MTKHLSFLFVILLLCLQLKAQKQVFTGEVIESESKKPVSYATLIIKNTIYGTQADENGKYKLELPTGYEKDSIVVNSLSYKEKVLAVSEMTKNQKIELELNSNILDEVVIYPVDPKDIFKKAAENYKKNHKMEQPTEQQVFARELFFDKGKCFRVGESIGMNVYNVKLPKYKIKETTLKKTLKARGIQDSAKVWFFNDMFRVKQDTISFDESVGQMIAGFDITSLFGEGSGEKTEQEQEKENKKRKGSEVHMDFNYDLKYNGTVKVRGRTTHRILAEFLHKQKTIMKGQFLIDSATYAFSQVQLANQNVDLFREFAPWYVRGMLRLLGYKPVVNRLSIMSSYAINDKGKWYKFYDYYRFGGSIKKRKRTLDGYAETECFYSIPKLFKGNVSEFYEKNKKGKKQFEETSVVSFDDDKFWQPFKGYSTPKKVKYIVDEIHKRNEDFEGSIGYNKKESRKKRKEERRRKRLN